MKKLYLKMSRDDKKYVAYPANKCIDIEVFSALSPTADKIPCFELTISNSANGYPILHIMNAEDSNLVIKMDGKVIQ